ncbi:Spc98 family-domain-containing protein [Calycina marina]|uniref:Spindle pole body component n=1 Tax=Calycina marina TaxID=1763456 RepID=A0A9P7YVP1_9HELO|nr:Spc98 family-domain-containing protein [Calycina marina]
MAHIAKLGALTDELVVLLTSTSPKANQFDVENRLDGLEEKLAVYNEDLLANALKKRRDALVGSDQKWVPEILHLLLELSDKPLSKSRLEDLDFNKELPPDTGPNLRWEDLAAEDPLLRSNSVWKNVDFGAESSEDDDFDDTQSKLSELTEPTDDSNFVENFTSLLEESSIKDAAIEDLKKIRKAQFWQKDPSVSGARLTTVKKPMSELQAIREVLFMLSGYPTSLFEDVGDAPNGIIASTSYALKHVSIDGFQHVIRDLAKHWPSLKTLRSWVEKEQTIPLVQVLRNAIAARLDIFDMTLTDLQHKCVVMPGDVVVSLLQIQSDVNKNARPLLRLSRMVTDVSGGSQTHAFRYLEMLFDETCNYQLHGDDEMYSYFGTLFFECFQVYLRPIRRWMEEGELMQNDKVFFISEVLSATDLGTLWKSKFKIRKTPAGVLHAPVFMHASACKIFTTGKSVVVLKLLNRFRHLSGSRNDEPLLNFNVVCSPLNFQLAPFSELFNMAIDNWVKSKHQFASLTLRKTLFESCNLHESLNAISSLYLLDDGAIAAQFVAPIFDKLDTLDPSWNDRHTVTEYAQSTFGILPCVASDHLQILIRSLPRKYEAVEKCRRSVKTLAVIEMKYMLSWPVQIILKPASKISYQKIFSFLVQIRRSSHILQRRRIVEDTLGRTNSTDERALYYYVRTRLLWFTQTLYNYLTAVVLEPNTRAMKLTLRDADDLDAMIIVHETYMKTILDQALLGSKLELIHMSILKILDQSIQLEDAQAANSSETRALKSQQRDRMDLSMASLGLQTPAKSSKYAYSFRRSTRVRDAESSDDELNVDLSILTSTYDEEDEVSFVEALWKIRADYDRLVRFVASGVRGAARASGGEESKSWDLFGEMLESGLDIKTVSWK